MIKIRTPIKDLYILDTKKYHDNRGYFSSVYNEETLGYNFIQMNESNSRNGVVRGLHFQNPPYEQAKLVRCLRGSIIDYAVDLRNDSETYKCVYRVGLTETNRFSLLIPRGFAHGFIALEEDTIVNYLVDNIFSKEHDSGIYFDESLFFDITRCYIMSDKDKSLERMDNLCLI